MRCLVLGTTRTERCVEAFTRFDAGVARAFMGGRRSGLEVLPDGYMKIVEPLRDMSVEEVGFAGGGLFAEGLVDMGMRHAEHKQEVIRRLVSEGEELVKRCVLSASHWGYLLVNRRPLAHMYACASTRHVAIHALARMTLHVSGSETSHVADDEQIMRLANDLLKCDEKGAVCTLPKGRTAAGMVVRPITGRFGRRVLAGERSAGRYVTLGDVMLMTREPDHESGGLLSTRLRGNYTCAPLWYETDTKPRSVYWDNRFVLTATPASQISSPLDLINFKHTFLAALASPPSKERMHADLQKSALHVRQLRRADWETFTTAVTRVRDVIVPFHCVRALPGVCEMGGVVASPHLGVSARADLVFGAVRVPSFRCLPKGMEPGFGALGEDFDAVEDDDVVGI